MIQQKNLKPGFSLIEIMIVIGIIAVIMAGVFGGVAVMKRAREGTTKTTLRTLQAAISAFQTDTGVYPTTLSDLVNRPADEKIGKKWGTGGYLDKEIVNDSFGNEYVYRVTKGGKQPYELYSYGPNGEGSPEVEWIHVWDL